MVSARFVDVKNDLNTPFSHNRLMNYHNCTRQDNSFILTVSYGSYCGDKKCKQSDRDKLHNICQTFY